jgi:abortive infection bacteriophage resistance protein
MEFNKPPISIPEQVALLQRRGLVVTNTNQAISYLSNINYYRLRAYTYPFQNNTLLEQPFIADITFDDIIQLYVFDRKLRIFVFDAIEKIEIALRSQMIYHESILEGSHWYLKSDLYRDANRYQSDIEHLKKEIDRSSEIFLSHYKNTYTEPVEPPVWMAFEVAAMGTLSKIYSNLKNGSAKRDIANHFGLSHNVLQNWLQHISIIRNICAHHGRLWNRPLSHTLMIPNNPQDAWLVNSNTVSPQKIYHSLSAIIYLLNRISPGHSFTERIVDLIVQFPIANPIEMGFTTTWQEERLWHTSF